MNFPFKFHLKVKSLIMESLVGFFSHLGISVLNFFKSKKENFLQNNFLKSKVTKKFFIPKKENLTDIYLRIY